MIDLEAKRQSGPIIRLHPDDNVVIARVDIGLGTQVPSEGFSSRSQAPAGTLVHSHNIEFREFDRDYAYARDFKAVDLLPPTQRASFQGIVRDDARVTTRNYIGILSTVNCSATVIQKIAA